MVLPSSTLWTIKRCKVWRLCIWNASQAYAPNALAVLLSGDRDQAFGVCKPPGCSTGFFCTPISFIDFDNPGETVSSRACHRTAQLMQKAPLTRDSYNS